MSMAAETGSKKKCAGTLTSLLFILGLLAAPGCGENGAGDGYGYVPGEPYPAASPGDGSVDPVEGEVQFSWDPNTEPDLAGYRLYRSRVSGWYLKGNFLLEIPARPGEIKTFTVEKPSQGLHFWVVTAYDTGFNESGFSDEVAVSEE
jgi:hypothetical protein